MPKIFRYVIVTDAGTAPHADGDFLSLCICKPNIRLAAAEGDYVMAFLSTAFGYGEGRISWVGRVDSKLTLGDYHLQFPDRPDAIYERTGWKNGEEELQHIGGNLHADEYLQERDKRGRYALVMKQFWYWGRGFTPPSLPDDLVQLVYASANHKAQSQSQDIARLENWLDKQSPGKLGGYRTIAHQGACAGPTCNPRSTPPLLRDHRGGRPSYTP